jgi:hypothetical protein
LVVDPEAMELIKERLRKPLQNFIGRIIHDSLVKDQIFKTLLTKKDKVVLKKEKAAPFLAIQYMHLFKDIAPAKEQQNGKLVFNKEKVKQILFAKTDDEISAVLSLTPLYNFLVNDNWIFEQPLEMVIKLYHPNLSIEEGIKAEAKEIDQMMNYLGSQISVFKAVQGRSIVVQKALAGAQLSEVEKLRLRDEIQSKIIFWHLFHQDVKSAFLKVNFDQNEFLKMIQTKYLSSKAAQSVANPKSFKGLLQTTVAECETKLAYSYASLPTANQLAQFKKNAAQVVSMAQSMVEEKLKKNLQKPMAVTILYPDPKENSIASWNEMLLALTQGLEAQIKEAKNVNLDDPETLGQFWLAFSAAKFDGEPFDDILTFCDQAKTPYFNDAALASINTINLSWPTITHPQTGVGILAHEVGHVIQGNFGSILQREVDCLKQKQNSEQYLSEDFADLFSSELLVRMNMQVNAKPVSNFACSLMQYDSKHDLKNDDSKDPHSSNFYRLVTMAIGSNTMTKQCDGYLDSIKETRFADYCTWEK